LSTQKLTEVRLTDQLQLYAHAYNKHSAQNDNDNLQAGPKMAQFLVRRNFIKYLPIFKIIPLSESGENV